MRKIKSFSANLYFSALCVLMLLQTSCVTSIPGSTQLSDITLESHAIKIAWMKACQSVVQNHTYGKCLAEYFSGEVSYQESKVGDLKEKDKNELMMRVAFLTREYEATNNTLGRCIEAHTLGVNLLNAIESATLETATNKKPQKVAVPCVPVERKKGIIYSGRKE